VAELALDLGAGVGVVALVLHRLGAARRFALVEREPRIAELSRRNLEHAGAPGEVLAADLEKGLPSQLERAAALVVMNPPFFETERHLPKDRLRRDARHGSLAPFLEAARTALSGARARAAIAYPANALAELMDAAHRARLTPKRLRLVHPFATRPARLALLELRLERAASIAIEPPLIEWIRPGIRSPELTEQISGRR
jgi:tRNA1Val (adenine37-N6)-methyltransferase